LLCQVNSRTLRADNSKRTSTVTSAIYAAIFFTVVLLVTTAYFLMGGLPLLILNHDSPVDARFVRGFFNVYYRAAFLAATGAAAGFALSGRPAFAVGVSAIALTVFVLRRKLIPAMEQLGEQIQSSEASAIDRFRRIHFTALLVNLALLVALVWGLTKISL
jgi:hypothetical protein